MPVYKPDKFKIISEEQWTEMIQNDDCSDAFLQNEDKKKVDKVDNFMKRVTLDENKLQYFIERGIEPCHPKDLRVILVGKVRLRS